MSKDHLNTFKICLPEGTEKFDYLFPIYLTPRGQAMTLPVPQLRFKNIPIKMVIDFYIDFTDYTLYNTKKITFHHLN